MIADIVAPKKTPFLPKLKLRQAREKRGLSVRKLAALSGVDATTISNLENGKTQLLERHVLALSLALEVPGSDIWESETSDGALDTKQKSIFSSFREDAEKFVYDYKSPPPPLTHITRTQLPYRIKSRVLDQIGLIPGDIVIFDIGPERLQNLKSEDIVIAQYYNNMISTIIVRQFIAPSLLITNSLRENAMPINIDTDNANIKGIFVSSYRW